MRKVIQFFLGLAGLLSSGTTWADESGIVIRVSKDKNHVEFRVGGTPVAKYVIGPATLAKPYLWPVDCPRWQFPLTRAWPMDKSERPSPDGHPHQKSVWFCHGDVIPEGLPLGPRAKGIQGVDFWSEEKGHGQIVCWKMDVPVIRDRGGSVATYNHWNTSDGRTILEETRTIHFYDLGASYLFVFDVDLRASAVPIVFGDTKEGSFGIRINEKLREKGGNGTLTNSLGKTGEANCWGRVASWCDYSGSLEGKAVGLAILDDPKNPFPCSWHARAYGLMAANPFGREKSGFPAMKGRSDLVRLAKGEHLNLRYGLLAHLGSADKVANAFAKFVELRDR